MALQRMTVKGVKAFVRPETSDPFVVHEVITGNAYRKLNIRPDDVVLDVGMNIGMFTVQTLAKGASVFSFEPDPENFKLATKNVEINGFKTGYELNNKAVVGTQDEVRTFSINGKKNKGAHSLVEKRGRSSIAVRCENINSAIERVNPTVIKMDIEGGEYECLHAIKSWGRCREFIMEFHHAHLNDIKLRTKYNELIGILKRAFTNVDYRPQTKRAWVSLVYANRVVDADQ
jgi:FkbM family methyltransferase